MPNKIVESLITKVDRIEKKLVDHLIDSGRIQTRLDVNTYLTGVILVALLAKFVADWFKH